MSESERDEQPDEPRTGQDDDARTGDDPKSEIARLRAELQKARKWEERAKQNADAAKRLAEIEDSQKSELEKLTEAQKAAEARAQAAERELARARVALRKGLPEALAKRLVGDTEEEMEADAEELLATLKKDEEEGDTSLRLPREKLRSGAKADAEPEETDPRKLAATVPRF